LIKNCNDKYIQQVIKLVDNEFIFSRNRSISLKERYKGVFNEDNYKNIFLYIYNECVVSIVVTKSFEFIINRKKLKGSMIGEVFTKPDYRGKGLSTELLNFIDEELKDRQIDFAVLWTGIHNFYKRLNWIGFDTGVLGKLVKRKQLKIKKKIYLNNITIKNTDNYILIDKFRREHLTNYIVRKNLENTYQSLPIPAEKLKINIVKDKKERLLGYIVHGEKGKDCFVYEILGDILSIKKLIDNLFFEKVFLNLNKSDNEFQFINELYDICWNNQNQAMWKIYSDISEDELNNIYIPYLDRI